MNNVRENKMSDWLNKHFDAMDNLGYVVVNLDKIIDSLNCLGMHNLSDELYWIRTTVNDAKENASGAVSKSVNVGYKQAQEATKI